MMPWEGGRQHRKWQMGARKFERREATAITETMLRGRASVSFRLLSYVQLDVQGI